MAAGAFPAYGRPVVDGHLEVERKYDVDGAFAPPTPEQLAALPGIAAVDQPVEHLLQAGYFDTPDLRLFRARVTLRRRTGGPDAGWHLKLPAEGGARLELHARLGRSVRKPPASLLSPVVGLLRGAEVGPIATLHTRRVVTALRNGAGRVLAEMADDTVTATVPASASATPSGTGAAEVLTWREIEVELVDGDESLLAAVGERLVAAGAAPSPRASKLGRAIASRLPDAGPKPVQRGKRGLRAGDVVLAALRAQVSALQAADVLLRTDQPDAVHRIRVACRRLRSILAAFRPVIGRGTADPLREELSWLSGALSTARDEEVALGHLRAVVAAEPVELVLGPVAARLQQTAIRAAQAGHAGAVETLSGSRYLRLLDDLHALLDDLRALLDDPPVPTPAGKAAPPVLRAALRRAARRLERQLERASRVRGDGRDEALHDVRVAAKRLRDTAEVARPELGRPAKELVRVTTRLQRALGEQQDAVVTREHCRRLAIAAHAAGESSFSYGRLHALEEFRAARALSAVEELEPRLRKVLGAARTKP
ncbi:MAG: domain containing protein [Blastococcus sp.]|nr:domain containing protein [Blastococcus sp.]